MHAGMRLRARLRELWRDDHGTVTAEFALLLPTMLVILALVIGSIVLAAQRITLTSAAAELVRYEARGDTAAATAVTQSLGGEISIERSSDNELRCITLLTHPGTALLAAIEITVTACAVHSG